MSILDSGDSLKDAFERGKETFGRLITRWMDSNGWSHPVMIKLATGCAQLPDGRGWLHSSQIAGLRHANLSSPGPRTFVALERLNYYLYRYQTERKLLPGTSSSNDYADAQAILDNGKPPSLGWWCEVFCGYVQPEGIDLNDYFFSEAQAEKFSENYGALIRRLLIQKQKDVVADLEPLINNYYPSKSADRVKKLIDVVYNRYGWTPEELSTELSALTALTGQLGGPSAESDLIKNLKT